MTKLLFIFLHHQINKKVRHYWFYSILMEVMKLGILHGNSSCMLWWCSSPDITAIGWYQRFSNHMDFEHVLLLTNQQPHKLWIFWFTIMWMPQFLVFLTTSIILLCVWRRFKILSLISQVFRMKWFDCTYVQANNIVSLHESITGWLFWA